MSNQEIAEELHLSMGTVKTYMERVFRMIGVANRTGLAVKWRVERMAGRMDGVEMAAGVEREVGS